MSELKVEQDNTRVKVALGFTKNLGNYQTLRIDIGMERDVRPGESLEEAQDDVFKTVDDELERRLAEVNEALDG